MKIVANGFTYDSGNWDVKVGDTVLLPYPEWHPNKNRGNGIEALVESITSDYRGPLRQIIAVTKRAYVPVIVSVKEIEKLVRMANLIVIDERAFKFSPIGNGRYGWVELI